MIAERIPMTNIVRQAKSGDRVCMNLLLSRTSDYFDEYFLRKLKNRHDCDDILQETLVSVMTNLHQLKDNDKFWRWAFKIARSKVAEHFRSRKRESAVQSAFTENLLLHAKKHFPDPVDLLLKRESFEEIRAHLDTLPMNDRELFQMRHVEEMPYFQMSQRSNLSAGLMRLRVCRVKKHLRRAVLDQDVNRNTHSPVYS